MASSGHNDEYLKFAPEEESRDNIEDAMAPFRILMVDDDEDIHLITTMTLKKAIIDGRPLAFTSAYSAKESIELLRRDHAFDLILLDIVMETDDAGFQVARYLRQDINNQHTKIIVRTGQPGLHGEERLHRDLSIQGFYLKTALSAMVLRQVITEVLSQH